MLTELPLWSTQSESFVKCIPGLGVKSFLSKVSAYNKPFKFKDELLFLLKGALMCDDKKL
jgi:hypothetical protein